MNERADKRVRDLIREPRLARLLAVLDGPGEETRVVGGAVRNALIGRSVADIDLATTATPDVTAQRARAAGFKVVPTGVDHGTVTVILEGRPFEVTTLREDVATDGRHAVVRFGRDFAQDALRRDFTMNALSLDASGRVHDTVGGLEDLAARRVRFIGDARTRIREDYLRILRFFRFTAQYAEGPLDRDGFEAAVSERAGLATLSRERVRAEFLKLLAAARAPAVLQDLSDAGLLGMLLGGVGETGRLWRVARQADEAASPDPIRCLAALAVTTVEDADRLRDALRLSNAEHDRLGAFARAVAALRSAEPPVCEQTVRRIVAMHGSAALADALAVITGEPRPVLSDAGRRAAERFAAGLEPAPAFPVRGADLVRRGIAPGEEVGRRLAVARERWLADGCPLDADATGRLIEAASGPIS